MIAKSSLKALSSVALAGAMLTGISVSGHAQSVDWDGLYLSGTLGGAFGDINYSDPNAPQHFFLPATNYGVSLNDVAVGGAVGVQKQFGGVVAGAEVSFTRLGTASATSPGLFAPIAHNASIDSLITATAVVGVPIDSYLIYGKGGYAGGQVRTAVTNEVGFAGHTGNSSAWHNGFVLGAGVARAINEVVSIGAEYNYVDLGSKLHTGTDDIGFAPYTLQVAPGGIHTVAAKLTFRLDIFK